MVVLDTSAIIYWTLDQEKLSPAAAFAIEQAEKLLASSISVWEIAVKIKNNKLIIPLPIEEYAARLSKVDKLEFLDVDVPTWLASVALDWEHRDPADIVILATSKLLGLPLITSDRRISKYYTDTIW
jgi:PIN domain nuclease of toxin-antitoxin system